eukprot:c23451_g1_i5 orf=325-723(+)
MKPTFYYSIGALMVGLVAVLFLSSSCSLLSNILSRSSLIPGLSLQNLTGGGEKEQMVVVYITAPNNESGQNIARSIVSRRLAACVNQISGIESTYWWNGKVETASEVLLIIKTRLSLVKDLAAHVKDNHPYE